uniref:Uncharacterized protein n=1 Tax=Spironucleus salmonicida TaxID=348837 RepID=V6LV83_9EUKA|eukprot:EST44689.1 Hypothetical protein SS50377_15399 [Spironucleus salmonicida]
MDHIYSILDIKPVLGQHRVKQLTDGIHPQFIQVHGNNKRVWPEYQSTKVQAPNITKIKKSNSKLKNSNPNLIQQQIDNQPKSLLIKKQKSLIPDLPQDFNKSKNIGQTKIPLFSNTIKYQQTFQKTLKVDDLQIDQPLSEGDFADMRSQGQKFFKDIEESWQFQGHELGLSRKIISDNLVGQSSLEQIKIQPQLASKGLVSDSDDISNSLYDNSQANQKENEGKIYLSRDITAGTETDLSQSGGCAAAGTETDLNQSARRAAAGTETDLNQSARRATAGTETDLNESARRATAGTETDLSQSAKRATAGTETDLDESARRATAGTETDLSQSGGCAAAGTETDLSQSARRATAGTETDLNQSARRAAAGTETDLNESARRATAGTGTDLSQSAKRATAGTETDLNESARRATAGTETDLSQSARRAAAGTETDLNESARRAAAGTETDLNESARRATAGTETDLSQSGRRATAGTETDLSQSGGCAAAGTETDLNESARRAAAGTETDLSQSGGRATAGTETDLSQSGGRATAGTETDLSQSGGRATAGTETDLSQSGGRATAGTETDLNQSARRATAGTETDLSQSGGRATAGTETDLSQSGGCAAAGTETDLNESARRAAAGTETDLSQSGGRATAGTETDMNQSARRAAAGTETDLNESARRATAGTETDLSQSARRATAGTETDLSQSGRRATAGTETDMNESGKLISNRLISLSNTNIIIQEIQPMKQLQLHSSVSDNDGKVSLSNVPSYESNAVNNDSNAQFFKLELKTPVYNDNQLFLSLDNSTIEEDNPEQIDFNQSQSTRTASQIPLACQKQPLQPLAALLNPKLSRESKSSVVGQLPPIGQHPARRPVQIAPANKPRPISGDPYGQAGPKRPKNQRDSLYLHGERDIWGDDSTTLFRNPRIIKKEIVKKEISSVYGKK